MSREPEVTTNVHVWRAEDVAATALGPIFSDDTPTWRVSIGDNVRIYIHGEATRAELIRQLWSEG